jgi:hypothetical protein
MGWYASNSGNATHPVIGKRPNAWGLYDMHGNVWEWCQDWYGGYPSGAVTDPTGPAFGADRVQRGGSYWESSRDCRSAVRLRCDPGKRFRNGGFRLLAISDGETVDAKADEVLSLGADNADAEFTNAAQEDTEAKRKVRQRGKTITRRLSENTR